MIEPVEQRKPNSMYSVGSRSCYLYRYTMVNLSDTNTLGTKASEGELVSWLRGLLLLLIWLFQFNVIGATSFQLTNP